MHIFNDILGHTKSGYFVGDTITAADLKAHGFFHSLNTGAYEFIPMNYLEDCGNINKFMMKMLSHPKVAEYYRQQA